MEVIIKNICNRIVTQGKFIRNPTILQFEKFRVGDFIMKILQTATLSLAAIAAITFSGCDGASSTPPITIIIETTGGGTTTDTTTDTTTSTPITATDAQTIVDNGDFTGLGALTTAERYIDNDASFGLPTAVGVESANRVDQAAIATLAATKTTDTTTLVGKLSGTINLTKDKKYKVNGLVKIDTGAVLNIEPGTIIYGDAIGDDYIVVMQGARIEAPGTKDEPIIFTSEAALTDSTSATVGQWGGLTVLGKAPTNYSTQAFYEVDETDSDFAFGGATAGTGVAGDNSGTLTNVYILNTGITMASNQEINGLSLCGVGSGTTVEDIHVENSSDDGIEVWGGTVDLTNLTIINAQDDSLDLDAGYVGTVTNVSVVQTEAVFAGFEISSGGDTPMTSPTIVNFAINKFTGSEEGGIYIKDDTTAPTFVNGLVTTWGGDAAINTKLALSSGQQNTLAFSNVILNTGFKFSGAGASGTKAIWANNAATEVPRVDQAAIATLAATKTTDTTTLVGKLSGTINLTKDKKYKVNGLVKIDTGAVLNIEPGTIIYGDAIGDDYIVVMQGARIEAPGTKDEPIIFTSEAALTDSTSATVGQWGGLTVLGKAPTNYSTQAFYEVDETDSDFAFGGATAGTGVAGDNSGTLTNVYILNTGITMASNQEINGLSLCGVGSGTTVEDIHVENSSDDGIEVWGGTVDLTNLTIINAQDDSLDLDAGYVGTVTNVSVVQTEAVFAGFEISSGGDTPMTSPTIVNFAINKFTGSEEGGIYIKDDTTAPTFVNGLVTTYDPDPAVLTKLAVDPAQEAALSFKDVTYTIK